MFELPKPGTPANPVCASPNAQSSCKYHSCCNLCKDMACAAACFMLYLLLQVM